ncbi:ead/Ea22-like family protein [Salmonella enterica]|nr:Eae protein [Salmonella enterica]EBU8505091.1 Eae protein [Salmonella enterica subsp. enterica serovar Agama]EGG7759068.1 ead/Ea22-like family protein [Salmonella enterica]EGG7782078.1 ead/Ea22-like family protein [Salmonella enterica]EGQ7555515.1 ead/Ea22-like family protein [Salmonella enterica subsp. enterica serovar Agama]
MKEVKIYTIVSDQLSPPITGESFCTDMVRHSDYADLEEKCAALAAENAHARERHAFIRALAVSILEHSGGRMDWRGAMADATELCQTVDSVYAKSPATDAFLAEVRAQAHKEGAYFVANRMLAAWDAGFIDDTAKNAADIARMILTSTEFMADAPEGDFDRSFADGVLEGIAAQLRKGVQS